MTQIHKLPVKAFKAGILPFISGAFILVSGLIIFQSYKAVPAKDSNQTVTGAPFNSNKTCSKCHGGGSFGGTISLQLLDASNKPVTSYTPGAKYTFKISMGHTTGTPKYGFQATAALAAGNTNYNNWGTLPSNTHNTTVSGRNYVEQSTSLTSGDISIPWTAPATGSGSITFYTAGNIVNGNSNDTGDQPVNTSLTVTEGTLPVSILYFKGVLQNNTALLTWATSQEVNNKEFVIEKSLDGKTFSQAAVIPAAGDYNGHTYSWTDISFRNAAYYRLKQNDIDGKSTYFNVVDIKAASSSNYDITLYTHAGANYILFYNGTKQQNVYVTCYDLSGRPLLSYRAIASEGNNMYALPQTANGIIIVSAVTEDGIRTSRKIAVLK